MRLPVCSFSCDAAEGVCGAAVLWDSFDGLDSGTKLCGWLVPCALEEFVGETEGESSKILSPF